MCFYSAKLITSKKILPVLINTHSTLMERNRLKVLNLNDYSVNRKKAEKRKVEVKLSEMLLSEKPSIATVKECLSLLSLLNSDINRKNN